MLVILVAAMIAATAVPTGCYNYTCCN